MTQSILDVNFRRPSGRDESTLRTISMERGYTRYAEGSVLICMGNTKVLCNASVLDGVPPFMRGQGKGWVTAEYSMLPRSTHTRSSRESSKGKPSGRTMEIQRLIGRSLRAVTDLEKLGERTIHIDCDVIQADGGTRCASITGAWVALADAVSLLLQQGVLAQQPLIDRVAAISVGLYQKVPVLDLDYKEDSQCDADVNVVMTGSGSFVEIQGTAEGHVFSKTDLDNLLKLAEKGIVELLRVQQPAWPQFQS